MSRHGFSIAAVALVVTIGWSVSTRTQVDQPTSFVGAQACRSCHQQEHDSWRSGRHSKMIQAATAATVKGTRAAISGHVEEWHVFASGQRKGTTSLPLVFTTSVAWLEPELLELYQATPPGLLELDVWLSPAAGQ